MVLPSEDEIRVAKVSTVLGTIEPFDPASDRWECWEERLDAYFEVNDVDDRKKTLLLINFLGAEQYRLLSTLTAPEKPNKLDFKTLVALMREQYTSKRLMMKERALFYSRTQLAGETLTTFDTTLKTLADKCAFGAYLDDMLRDRFILGIRSEDVRKRLMVEEKIDHKKAFEMARAIEQINRDETKNSGDPIFFTKQQQGIFRPPFRGRGRGRGRGGGVGRGGPPGKDDSRRPCGGCGGAHPRLQCFAQNLKCLNCGKIGHIKKVCRNTRAAVVAEREDEEKPFDVITVTTAAVEKVLDAIYATVGLNGQDMQMLVDTGAVRSLLSETTWRRIGAPPVSTARIRLVTYTGQTIELLGEVKLAINYKGKTSRRSVLVTKGQHPDVIGRDWLHEVMPQIQAVCTAERRETNAEDLQRLLEKHKNVFAEELGCLKGFKANVELKEDAKPRFCKPRPVPYAKRDRIEDDIDRLIKMKVLSPVKFSKWASPYVGVNKPSGAIRICGDYKATVNPQINVDQYPLPRPEQLFAQLAGGQKFTKIDLSDAYLQIELDDQAKELLTINTHKGLFRYNRLPFGVASAPAVFQRAMDQVTAGLEGIGVYLDDIIVTGRSDKEHLANLSALLDRLESYGLRVKRSKCSFMADSIEYLGQIVDKNGKKPNPKGIEAIREMPSPKNVKELRSYLGMVRYYDQYINGLSSLVRPLNELLKQDRKWQWTAREEDVVQKIKKKLTEPEQLAHYDPSLPLTLATDASPDGVGAVIFHTYPDGSQKPIEFASKSLSPAERNYAQIEKEALSIVYGVKKFHLYLFGRKFTLLTDHKPLLAIFGPKKGIPQMAASRLLRWAIILSAYAYDLQYRATDEHGDADGLSRLPIGRDVEFEEMKSLHEVVCQVEQYQIEQMPVTATQIEQETRRDPVLAKVLEYTLKGWPCIKTPQTELTPYYRRRLELTVADGCLLWGTRVVVPAVFQKEVIQLLHQGHPGCARMKSLARTVCYWPNIDDHLELKAKSCESCAKASSDPVKQPLSQWTTPSRPWERVHIDFAGPFHGSMWFVLVDALSCWPEVRQMKSTTTDKTTAVLQDIFATHGLPEVIVSDNGPQFTSTEFEQFCKQRGIKHKTTPPYHPQSNGLAERFVQTFKKAIKKSGTTSGNVQNALRNFLARYRVTPHSTTGRTPSEMLMNRRLRTNLDLLHPRWSKLEEQRHRQACQFNKGKRATQFEEGTNVWAKNTKQEGDRWLKAIIEERLGQVIVKVRTEDGSLLRRHKNQIKQRIMDPTVTDAQPTTSGGAGRLDEPAPATRPLMEDTHVPTPTLALRKPKRATRRPQQLDL